MPYKLSVERGAFLSDDISPVGIANISTPPVVHAPFGEQHSGAYEVNPTSVISNQMGNYRLPYEIVQTAGRINNNRWLAENEGILPHLTPTSGNANPVVESSRV